MCIRLDYIAYAELLKTFTTNRMDKTYVKNKNPKLYKNSNYKM